MKSHTVLAVTYVMVAVVQMTEECRRPEFCTSVLSIAPVALYRKRTSMQLTTIINFESL